LAVVAELGVAVYKSLIACKSSQLRDLKWLLRMTISASTCSIKTPLAMQQQPLQRLRMRHISTSALGGGTVSIFTVGLIKWLEKVLLESP
jgi:hypothetical protein